MHGEGGGNGELPEVSGIAPVMRAGLRVFAERIYSASSSTNVGSIQWQKPLSMAYRAPTVPPPSNPALSHTSPDHRWLIERFTVSMALPPKRDMRFRLSGSSV